MKGESFMDWRFLIHCWCKHSKLKPQSLMVKVITTVNYDNCPENVSTFLNFLRYIPNIQNYFIVVYIFLSFMGY